MATEHEAARPNDGGNERGPAQGPRPVQPLAARGVNLAGHPSLSRLTPVDIASYLFMVAARGTAGLPGRAPDRAATGAAPVQPARAMVRGRVRRMRGGRRFRRYLARHRTASGKERHQHAGAARAGHAVFRPGARTPSGVGIDVSAEQRCRDRIEDHCAAALARNAAAGRRQDGDARHRARAARHDPRCDRRGRRAAPPESRAAVRRARHTGITLRGCVSPNRFRANQDFGGQCVLHRHLPARCTAAVSLAPAAVQNAGDLHIRGRPAAGSWQPDLEHPDRLDLAILRDRCRDLVARVPRRDSQARVLPERAHRRRRNRSEGVGAADLDA
ncbi:hypothetical protein DFQ30_002838, partial [Apophysomyces sp. BC1015]